MIASAQRPLFQGLAVIAASVVLIVSGYLIWQQFAPAKTSYDQFLTFQDEVQTNVPAEATELGALEFVDVAGQRVDLRQFRTKRNVVLVITRGYTGSGEATSNGGYAAGGICLYCATQTSRLIANYEQFKTRDAEVLVVFPVLRSEDKNRLTDFEVAVQRQASQSKTPPFPIWLDVELKAVDSLGIRKDLSKPATYILDKQGQVRFAYVGATLADRPSVKALLGQLDAINHMP